MKTDFLLEKNLSSISLLTSVIGRNRDLLQETRIMSLRLTEDNPEFFTALCRPPLSNSDFIRPLDALAWDRSLATVLGQPLAQLQTMAIDWIGTMPNVARYGLRMSTKRASNTVSVSGVRDSPDRFYSFVPCWFYISTSIPLVRFESVHFVAEAENEADRSTSPNTEQKLHFPNFDFDIIDCKATEPLTKHSAWGSVGKARIIFNSDPYHAEILNVVRLSRCLHYLEVRARLSPKLQHQTDLTFQSYTKICRRGELQLAHLDVPFWLTPCDGLSNLAPLSSRPLRVLTRLDLSLCINDVANLTSFSRTFAEKLKTIERLNVMPSLQTIKLVPSFWMRETPLFGHCNVFAKLLRMITIDWANESMTIVFKWAKSTTPKEDSQQDRTNMFRWKLGINLNVTEIAKYVENVEATQEN